MTAPFKDFFSHRAAAYAAHRPAYPASLADYLADLSPARRLAWDCGCGSGQLSVSLADHFQTVVATDASQEQLATATPHARVLYRRAAAEDCGIEPDAADLIVAAQAAHWFDLPRFYREVRRVGRAGTVVALVAYGILKIDDTVDPVVERFYWDVLGPHWPLERRHVETGYRSLDFPFREVDGPTLQMQCAWALPDLVGYVSTWSAVREAERALGCEPVRAFAEALSRAWGAADTVRVVRWPLTLRVGYVDL